MVKQGGWYVTEKKVMAKYEKTRYTWIKIVTSKMSSILLLSFS